MNIKGFLPFEARDLQKTGDSSVLSIPGFLSYYKALQDSHGETVDCRPFIDFMLDSIKNALYKYVDIATDRVFDDPVNDPVKHLLILLKDNPRSTYDAIAEKLGKSRATVRRMIQSLKEQGILVRVGSDKSGYWRVVER